MSGGVVCDKITRGKVQPSIPNYTRINVSSMSTYSNIYRNLSPMLLGPITIIEPIQPNAYYTNGIHPGYEPIIEEIYYLPFDDELLTNGPYYFNNTFYFKKGDAYYCYSTMKAVCGTFERYWQSGKIYAKELNDKKQLSKKFFEERAKMYALEASDKRQRRRKYPRKEGLPIYSYYNGNFYDYVPSRKAIYIPLYVNLVLNTQVFRDLYARHVRGENLLIVGPDGRNIDINECSIKNAVNDPTHIFGHELVICALLTDCRMVY